LLERAEAEQGIENMLDGLSDREASILRLRFGFYGEPQTLEQIGKKYDVTRERIKQLEAKALRHLRGKHKELKQAADDYLDLMSA
jgi:RNA polymerase primary sigma factor